MNHMNNMATIYADDLKSRGYCVVADVLDDAFLALLRDRFSGSRLTSKSENFSDAGAFILPDYRDLTLVKLLTWPKTLQTLGALGFSDPKLHSFYVSTKQPHSEALSWHSDLFYTYEQVDPAELFLIYYLEDTTRANGCLRVIPGSHRWSSEERQQRSEDISFMEHNEVDVSIQAGDLFIGDRRILHATHANMTDTWRTCVTIAIAPQFGMLPETIRALIVDNRCLPRKGWWKDTEAKKKITKELQAVLPIYEGSAVPVRTMP